MTLAQARAWELPIAKSVEIDLDITHDWELPYAERVFLAALCKENKIRRVLEFGTFRGSSAVLFARMGCDVDTIDVPDSAEPFLGAKLGEKFLAPDGAVRPEYAGVRGGSATLGGASSLRGLGGQSPIPQNAGRDGWGAGVWGKGEIGKIAFHRTGGTGVFPAVQTGFDLAFIDGDHTEAGTAADGVSALAHVRPGGFIVWDDAEGGASHMGTRAAVEKFSLARVAEGKEPVRIVNATRLAIWRKP